MHRVARIGDSKRGSSPVKPLANNPTLALGGGVETVLVYRHEESDLEEFLRERASPWEAGTNRCESHTPVSVILKLPS